MDAPVVELSGRFPDADAARRAADALNAWFRWIVEGGPPPMPAFFSPFGVDSADYAWELGEDVDWELGPHARAAGADLRIALETGDTHLRIAGLLKALGAKSVRVVRDADA